MTEHAGNDDVARGSGWKRHRLLVVAGFTVAVSGAATGLLLSRSNGLEDELGVLRAATVPPEVTSESQQPIVRKTHSVETAWSFETSRDWPTYRAWVLGQAARRQVRVVHDGEGRLELKHIAPGDIYFVTVERVSGSGGGFRVRVVVVGVPS